MHQDHAAGQVYHRLIITAADPSQDIWLGDLQGHLVQKAVGVLNTRLMPGDYVVEFGLGSTLHSVCLNSDSAWTQVELSATPPVGRPVFVLGLGQ